MAKTRIEWHGERVLSRVRRAQVFGVDKTMSDCVIHAKNHHEWRNRTGTLEGSIRIVNFAAPHARGARGTWGSADVRYALAQEKGAPRINLPARPYLQPAADVKYPELPANIRLGYARGRGR